MGLHLWLCSFVRLTNSSPHALRADGGKKTTERPSVRVVNPCREARSVEPTRTYTAITAAFQKHQSLRLLCEHHLLSQWTISILHKSNGRSILRHESVTTSPRRRPQAKRRWLLSQTHHNPTGTHSEDGPNPRPPTDGSCTHSSPAPTLRRAHTAVLFLVLHSGRLFTVSRSHP